MRMCLRLRIMLRRTLTMWHPALMMRMWYRKGFILTLLLFLNH
uniref:Uncharacterized protein n=1 Tax=Anguilla anguilla TaxID=7936 RepID=A0A0E9RW19_ANGAN